ncbi:MAG: choice-of-anchor D domain-containing protein [bacterium]|nr:choice-of-anchor D domain-containing protein [bacterium]
MNKMLAAAALLVLMSVSTSAQNIGWGYYFYMSSPSTGSVYTRGVNSVSIQWRYDYCPCYISKTVSLDWSSNGGASWTNITSGLYGGTTSYTWNIPTTQTASTNYRIKVYEDNSASWGTNWFNEPAISGQFTILRGCATPIISSSPLPATVCANTSQTFTVASDMTDGTYQWKQNGNVVATTSVPSYTINPVSTSHAGVYTVTLIENCNPTKNSTSGSANFVVNVAPSITQHPQPIVVICQSGRDTLKARGIGVGRTFQWRKDGVNIPFATDSNYVVDNAQLTSEGSYTLVITGTCAPPAISNPSVVSVVVRPAITTEPTSLALCPGSSGQLSVVASGNSLSYQWYRNNVAVAGTGSTLPFTNYAVTQDGQYYVIVTSNVPNPNNCAVTVKSAIVTVTGYRPPTVVTQPTAVEGCVGKSVSLTSEFQGFGLTYSWTRNGATIPNSASNSLLLSNLTTSNSGDYVVTATGTCGLSVSSTPVRVNVVKTPTFSTQPVSKDVNVGQPLTLTLAASDASIIKWYKDGKLVVGQTGTTLTIPSASLSDAGYYNATVSNACSGISSAYARVTVTDPTSLVPRLTMSQETADLGQIPLGYNTTQTFSTLIQNTGTAVMTVSDVSITGTGFAIANATATPFTLAPGATSSVSIRATAENLSPMTGTLTVTTDAPVPTGMLNLTATPVLRYTAAADVSYGEVMQSTTKDSCIKIVNSSTTDITVEDATISGPNAGLYSVTSAIPMTITAGGTGEICVRFSPIAVGQNLTAQLNLTSSNGGNSTITLIGASTITGVDDLETRSGVTIYPNPARDEVSIRTASPATITIVNARGAKVATLSTTADRLVTSWNTKSFNGTSVAAGTYSVRVAGPQGTVTVPLVVVR